jgi:hypothetical protein
MRIDHNAVNLLLDKSRLIFKTKYSILIFIPKYKYYHDMSPRWIDSWCIVLRFILFYCYLWWKHHYSWSCEHIIRSWEKKVSRLVLSPKK